MRADLIRVQASPIHGHGVFAARRIRKGTRIIEYTGERISHAEADARYQDDEHERPHVLLFIVDDETVIDAANGGNEARFINHSCAPNCEAVVEGDRVFIEAVADIPPGAELTYDYNLEREGRNRAAWERRYACNCGSPKCRGTMLKPRPKRRRRTRGKV